MSFLSAPSRRHGRRTFLKNSLSATAAAYAGVSLGFFQFPSVAQARAKRSLHADPSPMRSLSGSFSSSTFNGDEYRRPHDILWHLDTYVASKGGWPTEVSETRDVVIIGGGLSGLMTAHYLRGRDWTLLEQATQFGGNSKSEVFNGARFSLGPAYITVPEAGSLEESFLTEMGLSSGARHEKPEETRILFGGLRNLWAGETDPQAKESAARIEKALREVNTSKFPDVPWVEGADLSRDEMRDLDRQSAEDWLNAQGTLHPHVWEYFQLYAWSAFGGSLEELSAAQFLNFAAPEVDGVLAFPGGNGAIAQALYDTIESTSPGRLRANTLVLDVREKNGRVETLIESPDGNLQLISSASAIVAAPKYVARHLLRNVLDADRARLWDSLNYRAYMVANVLLSSDVASPAFDIFCLRGQVPDAPSFGRRSDRNCTDLVFADWAQEDNSSTSILTLYRPYPLDGARNFLMAPQLHDRMKTEFATELKSWLPQLGIPESAIGEMRLTLWGHSCPLAKKGLFADGSLEQIGAPLGSRIFFANQDDAMNPSFESCLASAYRVAGVVP